MTDNQTVERIAAPAVNYDVSEFVRGQRDCRDGVEHRERGESYTAGYRCEYELEQMRGAGL